MRLLPRQEDSLPLSHNDWHIANATLATQRLRALSTGLFPPKQFVLVTAEVMIICAIICVTADFPSRLKTLRGIMSVLCPAVTPILPYS